MSKKNNTQAEQLYEVSGTNRKMINYKVYRMTANEKILYFVLALVVGAAVAYLFYGGIGKDEYCGKRPIPTNFISRKTAYRSTKAKGRMYLFAGFFLSVRASQQRNRCF